MYYFPSTAICPNYGKHYSIDKQSNALADCWKKKVGLFTSAEMEEQERNYLAKLPFLFLSDTRNNTFICSLRLFSLI